MFGARVALALSAVIAVSVAVSGCGWFSSSSSSEPATSSPGACPTVAILRPLSQTAVFAPGAPRQPTGVAFYGILSDVESKCVRSGDSVRVTIDTVIIGERGPASGAATGVDLQYFVAATAAGDTILSKRTLPVQMTIPAATRRAGITDHVEEWVSLGGRSPTEVNVVLGFQQSPEVVQFYKNYRGR
ncbi:MAG: hypothetical protein AB7T18_03705 [Alphaproteobacteria bacterium]